MPFLISVMNVKTQIHKISSSKSKVLGGPKSTFGFFLFGLILVLVLLLGYSCFTMFC